MKQLKAMIGRMLPAWRHAAALLAALALLSTPALAATKTLMLYGDSLMAGYGLPPGDGFAAQLQAALTKAGQDVTIVNASQSGDTSKAALGRIDWSLGDLPDAVLLEIGANDMLRGLPVEGIRANLKAILDRLAQDKLPVLLAGMKASPALGEDYRTAFDALYPALAQDYGVLFYPFFLEGVALDPALNQSDMEHPNAKGVAIVVANMLPSVVALLDSVP